jgi:hypothetical protein
MRAKYSFHRILWIFAAELLSGCMGSTVIRQNFTDYSHTLHYNAQQQMLQNLVHLKYRETPFFLKVGALSVNYELEVGGTFGIDNLRDANTSVGLEMGPTFLEKPTVTYTPVEGDVFVKQMLKEIDASVFALLVRAGWPVELLCYLTVDSISGHAVNAPDNNPYKDIVKTLAVAQASQSLQITAGNGGVLMLDAGLLSIPMNTMHFRSFLDVMYELSKNVEVPDKHQSWVRANANPNGLIHIRPSIFKPADTYVAVVNKGYYFSIRQDDVASKDVFSLLQILYQMQAGDVKGMQPVFTLPVGG